MNDRAQGKIVCLTNIFDQNYHNVRGEEVDRQLTTPFRRDLFRCLELASGRELTLLSSPPKAAKRRLGRWLSPLETKFSGHRQLFCANWDIPKLRIPLSWIFYARHVLRHVHSGDIVLIDNYELIYIIAARILNWRRRVKFLLVYLDGKHLIDHGWSRVLSGLAEIWGRPLFSAACISNPTLAERLPRSLPTALVPGFLRDSLPFRPIMEDRHLRLLYTGTLARSHGIDLLLKSIKHLPKEGWHLTIAGRGPLAEEVIRAARDPGWQDKVTYLEPMPSDAFEQLLRANHVGLNCQRTSDPISAVTFPSKVFTYIAAGLVVISSRASNVTAICGDACQYFESEDPTALAQTIQNVMKNYTTLSQRLTNTETIQVYTLNRSVDRLQKLLLAGNML